MIIISGVAIASSESTNVFRWMFEFFKSNRFTDGLWAPEEIMADNSRAISAAVAIVFPDAYRRNCFAHVIRSCDERMRSLHFSDQLKSRIKNQIHELARCAFDEHFIKYAEALLDEWSSNENENLTEFATYFRRQYVERDKNYYARNGAGCRTDNAIEGSNHWIKVIFITRRLPLLSAADKMKKFLVKSRDTNYGLPHLRITNADWVKAYDFKKAKPQVRYDAERQCYYVQRSTSSLNADEFGDFLDSMDLVDWSADDISIFLKEIAVVSPSVLFDDVLTCNCHVGCLRVICKHVLLIEVCVLHKRDFPNISAMRQTVSETGRNTPGRPRKHTAALLKE